MSKIVPFRSREQREEEKNNKSMNDWEAYLAMEKEMMVSLHHNEKKENSFMEDMTEEDIAWLKEWVKQDI